MIIKLTSSTSCKFFEIVIYFGVLTLYTMVQVLEISTNFIFFLLVITRLSFIFTFKTVLKFNKLEKNQVDLKSIKFYNLLK